MTDTTTAPGTLRRPAASPMVAAAFMLGAILFFTVQDVVTRSLAREHGLTMLVFYRYLGGLLSMLFLVPFFGWRKMVVVRHPGLQVARGLTMILNSMFVALSFRYISMAQTYAISFSSPLIAALIAAFFLRERTTISQWVWILVGFGGVLVALDPGAPASGSFLLFPVGYAVCNAGFYIITRIGGRDEEPLAMLFYSLLCGAVLVMCVLPWNYEPMPWSAIWLMFGGAAAATLGHVLLIEAFRRGQTAVVSTMSYSQLIWASLAAFLLFGEVPPLTALAGGVIVVVAGILLLRVSSRRAVPQAPAAE